MITNVVLVFDGDHNETFTKTVSNDCWFQVVITDGQMMEKKDRADNYMIQTALPELQQSPIIIHDDDANHNSNNNNDNATNSSSTMMSAAAAASNVRLRIHLVSADKELGKRAVATRLMKGGSIVCPPKFWKQYLPNLQDRQQQQQQNGNCCCKNTTTSSLVVSTRTRTTTPIVAMKRNETRGV